MKLPTYSSVIAFAFGALTAATGTIALSQVKSITPVNASGVLPSSSITKAEEMVDAVMFTSFAQELAKIEIELIAKGTKFNHQHSEIQALKERHNKIKARLLEVEATGSLQKTSLVSPGDQTVVKPTS